MSTNASDLLCTASTFASILPANATVEKIDWVSSGSSYGEGTLNAGYPTNATNLPALCAVTINVTSPQSSAYRFGILLPQNWNSRLLTVGNGGYAGGINWVDIAAGSRYGFAALSTDTGHNSSASDMTWALYQPEKRLDWGWRSVHGSVELGKKLVAAYYSKPASYSYYSGCSTGGRQGMREMQNFPQSFDGVMAGAPSWWLNGIVSWLAKVSQYNWPADTPAHIDWKQLPGLATAVMKQCDGVDGVTDGIISDPRKCTVDYSALTCGNSNANSSTCLTSPQIDLLKKVYEDYVTESGVYVYPGLITGTESGMASVLNDSTGNPYGLGYVRNFLDMANFTIDQYTDSIALQALELDPGQPMADIYDISQFKDRGGKFVLYQGLADPLVPAKGSSLYYDRLVQTMGTNVSGEFFRYFEIPGMDHCSGTGVDAPWHVGQVAASDSYSVSGFEDAQHDLLLALVDWVEKDKPIQSIVATTWKSPLNTSSGVLRQRPICPYPHVASWTGVGEINQPTGWTCRPNAAATTPALTSGVGIEMGVMHHWISFMALILVFFTTF
ncbi:hypothetical protein PFICI_07356 [Pestalotiopsis fici W106-1]|uniref:Carboxylic ester hydrolase n=1 Tax=Pestalotiopsis fici (strain W106-1 / CGMCC3.15140) TaxID=1229662 RepID=W3X363_PESFW|nr:uncharacterized protein PFICI_07356 [Pestalotiopsis fici W106-1]ETS79827.1 hypothetical protein PFICI_07356 [Pestalotiopsis fici W106-1]